MGGTMSLTAASSIAPSAVSQIPRFSLQAATTTASTGAGQGLGMNVNAAINPRLTQRLEAWKAYGAGGGTKSMREWVNATQRQYGGVSGGYSSGYARWDTKNFGKVNGNSLDATGPHDVYAILNRRTGEVLHIGETGRGVMTRFNEHQRDFFKMGIGIDVKPLRTVEGKAAAKEIEKYYIKHYERALGNRPQYNLNYH